MGCGFGFGFILGFLVCVLVVRVKLEELRRGMVDVGEEVGFCLLWVGFRICGWFWV